MKNSTVKKVLRFHASWCGSCHALSQRLEGLKVKYPEIDWIDVDCEDIDGENFEMVEKYKIRSLPTLLYLNEYDEMVYRHTGLVPDVQIERVLDN